MRGKELGQARQHVLARHAAGHVDAQAAAQGLLLALEQGVQLVHVRQQVLAALVVGLAVLGHLHLARGPVQQARAERAFQLLHGGGDAGLGQAQALRGAGEAGLLGHADEDLHGFESVHD